MSIREPSFTVEPGPAWAYGGYTPGQSLDSWAEVSSEIARHTYEVLGVKPLAGRWVIMHRAWPLTKLPSGPLGSFARALALRGYQNG